jgi:DNA polymerase III alpha subunit
VTIVGLLKGYFLKPNLQLTNH